MADEKKQKKRKIITGNDDCELRQTKSRRVEEESESFESPWSNLQLLLSLQDQSIQNKDIDAQRKILLAYNYVKYRVSEEESNKEIVGISRLVVFVNNWIQLLLISSGKRIIAQDFCLDHRCWEIFRFCLDESLKHKVSLSFKKDLLQVIQCIARDVLSRLSADIQARDFQSPVLDFYNVVLYCISCIFMSGGGISNKDINLWVSTVKLVLTLVRKILQDKLDDSQIGVFVLHFSCIVIDPYTKYLKVHPTGKKGFNEILENLLELLLYMLDVLHPYSSDYGWKGNLWKLIKEVLSQGLFHPIHIDGFMSVQSLNKYTMSSHHQNIWNSKMVVESYHRHFFDKVDKIMTGTNALTLGNNIGELFRSYVDCIKKQKELSVVGGFGQLQDRPNGQIATVSSRKGSVGLVGSHTASALNPDTRKLLFNFFVRLVEPLLGEIRTTLQDELEVGPILSTAHCTIKSINKLLVSLIHENVYVRIEDTSDGAFLNFLKVVYDTIHALSARIEHIFPSLIGSDERIHKEVIVLIVKELISTLKCLLEIECEVFGDDLERLWLMIISHGASGLLVMDKPQQSLLIPEIIQLGIQLISVYTELRQVNIAVFTLCKAVRGLLSVGDGQMCYSNVWKPSLFGEECAKILRIVLCSYEFRLSIYNAVKFIPEGQVSGFIQLLTTDVAESLVWMEGDCSTNARTKPGELDSDNCSLPCFSLKAEVLGRCLSELYSLILDSITATTGNSTLVGVAVKDLIGEIRPNMRCLVGVQSASVYSFLSTLTGRTMTMEDECKHVCKSTPWVIVFFFRLYMSSKSLYRQAVSLVPPDISRKMLRSMGDSWLVRTTKKDKGYFSWIVQPSASLPSTIKAVLRICNQDSAADYPSLIYVLITMTFQRLVDLNRLIKSNKYSQYKKSRKQGQQASDLISSNNKEASSLMHEAEELTSFLMEYIPVLDENQLIANDVNDCELSVQNLPNNDGWDFSISSMDKKSLPTATWWIVCQNIDVWCAYPAQDKLKDFLSLLIQSSLPSSKNNFSDTGEQVPNKHGHMKTIRSHQISVELVSNAALYEQSFVCRHMASSLFKILENSVSPIFRNFNEIYLNELPDWSDLSNSSRSSSNVASSYIDAVNNYLLAGEPFSYSSDKLHLFKVKIEDCQSLLKLICWMPKGYLKMESLSDYTNCIINLERLLLGSLIKFSSALQRHESHELFRLFVLCRKALNKLTMVYEERMEPIRHTSTCIHHENSFPTSWLLMSLSAVVELQHMFPDDCAFQSKALILSLMDHTSYMFLRFSRDQFMHVISNLTNLVKPCEEIPDLCLDTIVSIAESLVEQARKSLISLKEALSSKDVKSCTVQEMEKISPTISCIQGFLWGLASALDEIDGERCKLKSKSSKLKCDPFLRIRTHIDAYAEFISDCLNIMFLENGKVPQNSFETLNLPISKGHDDLLFLKVSSSKGCGNDADHNEKQQISQNAKGHFAFELNDKSNIAKSVLRKHDDLSFLKVSSSKGCGIDADHNEKQQISQNAKGHLAFELNDKSYITQSVLKHDGVASLFTRSRFRQQYLKKSVLLGVLRGENLEAACFIRQLFIAYSAILRINLRTIKNKFLSESWNPTFVGIAEVLLLEFADMVESPHELCFVWLDGIAKFLEELGRQLYTAEATLTKAEAASTKDEAASTKDEATSTKDEAASTKDEATSTKDVYDMYTAEATLTKAEATSTKDETTLTKAEDTLFKDVYDMLNNMHLRALGKCIALQGKGATLASHETESSIKTVDEQTKLSESSYGQHSLNELKARLRLSFRVFVENTPVLRLKYTIEAIERAVVGLHEGSKSNYQICAGNSEGGKISSIVAAGVDCLDLVLEHVKGRKHLAVVKKCIRNIVSSLFNIILHLQGPSLFFASTIPYSADATPDSGSVILMIIEVLTRVFGKHTLAKVDGYVSQSLRISGGLFHIVLLHKVSKANAPSMLVPDSIGSEILKSMDICAVDRKFMIELYSACCRLLYTVLRHYGSESHHCSALLEGAVHVLLCCLEMVDVDPATTKDYFSWKVEEGIKCAYFLRRIYEEARQQKDVLGCCVFQLLSGYILIYSGGGPCKMGIRREIDEALRPGIYALIDACSEDDLQRMHTVFGEGPCRSSLATLQHDYKLNFQYEGKV